MLWTLLFTIEKVCDHSETCCSQAAVSTLKDMTERDTKNVIQVVVDASKEECSEDYNGWFADHHIMFFHHLQVLITVIFDTSHITMSSVIRDHLICQIFFSLCYSFL